MKSRFAPATLLLLALAALAAAPGCGHDHVTQPPPPQEVHGIDQGGLPPVLSAGLDSAHVGGTATLTWWVINNFPVPIKVRWTLESEVAWPGLPEIGYVDLEPGEQRLFTTPASVPDTAATGYHMMHLTVRFPGPRDIPAYGWFVLVP